MASVLGSFHEGLLYLLIALGVIHLLCGLDDLFVDFAAFVLRLRPKRMSQTELQALNALPEKPLAIIVPAWRESGILRRMILGNLASLDYQNYHFFVGVYPNDEATVDEVTRVARTHPRVHVVVNSRPGPSSKGQMLNQVVREIFEREDALGVRFSAVVMQDAEDVMHAKVLRLMNRELDRFPFVQVPIFSLPLHTRELIAGTYLDEFAESHTKDLLVRERLGAAIPSAGVGTALARPLLQSLIAANGGAPFRADSLTEDYTLGVQAKALGFETHFACFVYNDATTGRDETIATREYFPKRLRQAIRQKTRWSVGIALQGWRNLGWVGPPLNRYFLFRDRRGLFTNPLALLGYLVLAAVSAYSIAGDAEPARELLTRPWLQLLFAANLILMLNRLVQRARCVWIVYGVSPALGVPFRWPLATGINALASLHALRTDFISRMTRMTVAWVKTEHELPRSFGAPQASNEVSA